MYFFHAEFKYVIKNCPFTQFFGAVLGNLFFFFSSRHQYVLNMAETLQTFQT